MANKPIEDESEDVGPIQDPNPDPELKVSPSSIEGEGAMLKGTGRTLDLQEEIDDDAEEKRVADELGLPWYAIYRTTTDKMLRDAADAIDKVSGEVEEGSLKKRLDDAGLPISEIPIPDPVVEPQPTPEAPAAEKAPTPTKTPDNPGGDFAGPDPDPMVDGSVIKATCWTTLDAAADPVGDFSAKLKTSIKNGDFDTADVPYTPNFNGGDFVAGYDKNDHLVVYYLVTVAGDWQKDLSDLRDKIGAFTIDATDLGLASSGDLEILVVPIYRDHGMHEQEITVCEDGEEKTYIMLVRDVDSPDG